MKKTNIVLLSLVIIFSSPGANAGFLDYFKLGSKPTNQYVGGHKNSNKPPHGGLGDGDGGGSNNYNEGNNNYNENGKSETKSKSQAQNMQSGSSRIKATVAVVPYLDFDLETKITYIGTPKPDFSLTDFNLVDEGDKYKVTKRFYVDAGVGISVMFHHVVSSASALMPFVGILPIGGKEAQFERTVYGRDEVDKIVTPKRLPPAASEVLGWGNNDSITYQAHGGLLFFGGVGAYGGGGAITLFDDTKVNTKVTKADNKSIIVRIIPTDVKTLRGIVGHMVANLNINWFKEETKNGFAYRFDISNPNGLKAYEDFVNGNLITAQKLALNNNGTDGVRLVHTVDSESPGRGFDLWLGVPILANYIKSSGKVYTNSETYDVEDLEEGPRITRSKVDYGIYNFASRGKFFFRHASKAGAFVGAHYTTVAEEGAIEGTKGSFVWAYESDVSTPSKATDALEELSDMVGLENDLKVTFPSVKSLGYLHAQFSMEIPEVTSQYLISLGADIYLQRTLLNAAKSANADYIYKECNKYVADTSLTCQNNEYRVMGQNLSDMNEALQEMYQAHAVKNWKDFAKAYADFGKAILKNRTMFQTFLTLVREYGSVTMALDISGEKISKLHREIINK